MGVFVRCYLFGPKTGDSFDVNDKTMDKGVCLQQNSV